MDESTGLDPWRDAGERGAHLVGPGTNAQAGSEGDANVRTAPGNSRKLRLTASYVRQSRPRNLRSYVRTSAAMLMVAEDDARTPKARRKGRIASGLRLIRSQAGLTQQELAERAEMPRERVVEYENEAHEPGPDKLERFADVLGVASWEFEAAGAEQEAGEC